VIVAAFGDGCPDYRDNRKAEGQVAVVDADVAHRAVKARRGGRPEEEDILNAIARRILWLAVRMIHDANHVRPSRDGLKVGGHQASSASVVSMLTALYFRWLRAGDLVSVKPHASPAYHALQYLLGNLDVSMLPRLRAFGGLQSYPSRTKDPDRVDFSTGSVGLGAVAPLFAALADRYLRLHFVETVASQPERRFVALVGDAELDEGNVWEALLEDALGGLGNVTIVVDLNRQSLDRVVPGIRIRRLEAMFNAAGWHAVEAKYGRRLQARFVGLGGRALRGRIDDMLNEEYQVLIRRPGPEARARLIDGAAASRRDEVALSVADVPDDELPGLLADLGGHDIDELERTLRAADRERARPTVVFAYTIKGWRLPFAGDSLNHSALLNADQVEALSRELGADPSDPWAGFTADSPEGRLCSRRRRELGYNEPKEAPSGPVSAQPAEEPTIRLAASMSTQQAFGDTLAALARDPAVGPRLVTAAPDVAVSTNLGGWINRAGVFSLVTGADIDDTQRPLVWRPGPAGRHVELGISEMNLFLWLSQFGLTRELFGEALAPIGAVYDPFICRGLDALIYALYVKAQFVLAGTPSGITLAPEGGAHQSTVTPSLGIELPGLRSWEPVFAREVVWCLVEGIRGCLDADDGFASYLRLATRPIDQRLAEPVERRLGLAGWRQAVLDGGYRLIDAGEALDPLPAGAPMIQIVAAGAVVPEAVAAVRLLHHEEVAANLIIVTSAERLAAGHHGGRLRAVRDRRPDAVGPLARIIPPGERWAPIVTVADAASHSLSFVGAAFGAPVVPLGVDTFGQSGTIPDLYAAAGIDADHIIGAALLALELEQEGRRRIGEDG
jgi:pyruvate dehydrogenase E1 component